MAEALQIAAPDRPRIVVIVGPTASGKTALALALAERHGGEIVNADSRQVYRGMDIGTAKPSAAEQARLPHHLIDVRDPDEGFGLAKFLTLAGQAIRDITTRDRLPIVAGGTGQYVRALLEGWRAPAVVPNPALRAALLDQAAAHGAEALHDELARADPTAAAGIHPRNVRRVVRALEVIRTTARPYSDQRASGGSRFAALTLGLRVSRETLYRRIDERVDGMFTAGLVDEVRRLASAGYGCGLPAMSSIGYAEVCDFLRGDLTLAEAVTRTKTATHRLARAQGAWFREDDARIHWLDAEDSPPVEPASVLVRRFRAGGA